MIRNSMSFSSLLEDLSGYFRTLRIGSIKILWPLFVFLGITVLFTYPISLHPTEFLIGRPFDDALESVWFLQWYKHALLDLRVSPLSQPDIFYPTGWDLRFAILPPFYPTIMTPVTAVLGPVATYNLLLVGSTVGAGYGVFLLVRAMEGSSAGGIFAGIAYAFYPNRQVYMGGYLNLLLASMWLPWMVLALYQAVNRPQARGRWLLFAALAYALSIAGAWQYAYIATFTLFIFGLLYLLPDILRDWKSWRNPLILAGLLIMITSGSLLAFGFMNKTRAGASIEFSLEDLIQTSVSVERLLVPSALNPIFWDLAREKFPLRNGEDGVVTFGLIVIGLAVLGLITYSFKPRAKRAFLVLAMIALLLMAGPFLRLQGQTVTIDSQPAAMLGDIYPDLIAETGGVRVPMPALVIFELVPPLRSFHHFGRMGVVVVLCLGTFAGLGITSIQKKLSPPAGTAVGLVAILLLMVELNPQPYNAVTSIAGMHRSVDEWLAKQPQQKVIMEYPLWYSYRPQTLYYSIVHQQKMVNGYSIISPEYHQTRHILNQWPEEVAIDLLEEYGVDFVLVHSPGPGDDFSTKVLPQLKQNDRLEYVGHFTNDHALKPVPSLLYGRIQPLQETMQETFIFQLVDDR